MISLRFGPADLANVRFAISPLFEVWQSVRALQNPAAEAVHQPWLTATRNNVADLDLALLYAVQPPRGCNPDFIHPPPSAPSVEFEDELERMLLTPPERIRSELSELCGDRQRSAVLKPLVEDPGEAVRELAQLIGAYWERAIAPHWGRIRALLEGDVLYRARQSADGGAQSLFADIDPTVHYTDGTLMLDKPWARSVDLRGRGLLFVPSVFVWPGVAIIDEGPWQPTIIYPARGCALLWEPAERGPDALAALIGDRRASVLAALDAPRSTTELARRLGISPGSVSQHLSVLARAGVISRHRVRQVVLYARSYVGEMLLRDHRPEPPLVTTARHVPWMTAEPGSEEPTPASG
jgi:DNA-binding transcriptional ArsR family regulator